MTERPDYVPRTWTGGRINSWIAERPMRVFVWLLSVPGVVLAAAVVCLLIGRTVAGVVLMVAACPVGGQAVIYAPRALRAARAQTLD
jgi:ABC-type dipeptide/oligopeptide/nickel transport system permease subunit